MWYDIGMVRCNCDVNAWHLTDGLLRQTRVYVYG